MNFLVLPLQPVAGATGIVSRVQLPTAGRVAFVHPELGRAKGLPPVAVPNGWEQPRGALAGQRTQHQVQCRANCMAKANF